VLYILAGVAATASLAALLVPLFRNIPEIRPIADPIETPPDVLDGISELRIWCERHDSDLEALTLAVSEGIAGYKRHEQRVAKTVASARRLVAGSGLEHAGLEAESAEIRDAHEDPKPESPVLSVPTEVVSRGRTGIPGVSHQDLDRLREALHV